MTDGREEMDAKKFIYRETALIAVGEFILVGLMLLFLRFSANSMVLCS